MSSSTIIDLFKEPEYRPSIIEGNKVRSLSERKALQRQIEKSKQDHEIILWIEGFDRDERILKKDLLLIEKIKQAKNRKRLSGIIDRDEKYASSLKNKLYEISLLDCDRIIFSNTSIVTSKSIKPKSLSELKREVIGNKYITPLEKNIALSNLNAITQDNIPVFEMLNLHFLLKEVFNMWVDNPTLLVSKGVSVTPILFYENGFTNDYYMISIKKSVKHESNSYFSKIFEIFDNRNIRREKPCLRTKIDIISRILDINTIQKIYNLTKEFLNSIGIETTTAHFKNLKTAYLTKSYCDSELETAIKRFIEYNGTSECFENKKNIEKLFKSVLNDKGIEKSFFFLVNPKFFKDTKEEYINCSLQREWTEKINYEQLLSIENYVKKELPCLILSKDKVAYIGCSKVMIDEVLKELRFGKKQFFMVLNKLFSDITYMSTYDKISLREFINIEVDKVISEAEKLRSREKLIKIKKLIQVCVGYFLNHLTTKGYYLEVKDNVILKRGSIDYVV